MSDKLFVSEKYCDVIVDESGLEMAQVTVDNHGKKIELTRRIAACVNACAGISTENLEDNISVAELARRYNEALKQRDELLEALEPLRLKFRSGNCIPVERNVILAKEWASVEDAIAKIKNKGES